MAPRDARIDAGVRGPAGQPGFILTVPFSESLEWDLENEITSPSRLRLVGSSSWWIAEPYRETVYEILARLGLRPPE